MTCRNHGVDIGPRRERDDGSEGFDEIEITEEMERAGFFVLDDWTGVLDKGTLAKRVYIAMFRAKGRPILSPSTPALADATESQDD
jgi:hypothetical protein